MVNTGKPSRGCYMCRERRIKCDEGKPHCMKCQKSKRICPGYRDTNELKLRGNSKSAKKKTSQQGSPDRSANTKTQPGDATHDGLFTAPPSFSSSPVSVLHSRHNSDASMSFQSFIGSQASSVYPHQQHNICVGHMITPLAQQACCYFLTNFVLIPETGTMRGYLDFIIPLLNQRTPPRSLLVAFSAVTLAALAARPSSKALLPTAGLLYRKALKEINSALQDQKHASSDSTLASVMLMASFEQIIPSPVLSDWNPQRLCPSRLKTRGWSSHIDGAVAVIKHRASEQLQTPFGKELFIAVRAHMTLHCIANSKSVDTAVDWMSVSGGDPIIERLAAANLKMAQLRADNNAITTVRDRTAERVDEVLNLLRRAEALDKEYTDWVEALPPSWQIKTVAWIDCEVDDLSNSVVHPGRVLSYGELWMASRYSLVRGCRLFIWTTILRCVAWLGPHGDYRSTPQYTNAHRVCCELIEDIVASVPYFFGWNRGKDSAMADGSNFACGPGHSSSVESLAGIFAMWPIFAAATSDFASPSQRIFLRGRLKTIADTMGINQALIMFQATLRHPSLYIGRERLPPTPIKCGSDDIQLAVESSPPTAPIVFSSSPPRSSFATPGAIHDGTALMGSPDQAWSYSAESPLSTSNWIPRTFTEPPYLQEMMLPTQNVPFDQQIPLESDRLCQAY
ncbi:hypothetical protein QTJ16_000712 [Diplocarpon rosae]|uniref:Zn(2)-C6 fungal-type domain-containing protein n=1 Tax=Diplocarpon rosae TaxID=946125 RepID=A0AAD9T6F0_9HELO|nr:hypothetical protein QTJ16_000712 [Diplocarpon rosae]